MNTLTIALAVVNIFLLLYNRYLQNQVTQIQQFVETATKVLEGLDKRETACEKHINMIVDVTQHLTEFAYNNGNISEKRVLMEMVDRHQRELDNTLDADTNGVTP